MPLTPPNIEEAREKLRDVQQFASELNEILTILQNTSVLRDRENRIKIDMTGSQKGELFSEYEARKQALVIAVNNLL